MHGTWGAAPLSAEPFRLLLPHLILPHHLRREHLQQLLSLAAAGFQHRDVGALLKAEITLLSQLGLQIGDLLLAVLLPVLGGSGDLPQPFTDVR